MDKTLLIIADNSEVIKKLKSLVFKYKGLKLIDNLTKDVSQLEFFKKALPDILILSFGTFDKDKSALIEYIRRDLPDIQIIIVTDIPLFKYTQKAINEWKISYLIDRSYLSNSLLEKALDFVWQELEEKRINNGYKNKVNELSEKLDELSLYILHEEVIAGASERDIKIAEGYYGIGLDFDTREYYLGFCGYTSSMYSQYNVNGVLFYDYFRLLRSKIRNLYKPGYKAEVFLYAASKNFIIIVSRDYSINTKEGVNKVIEEIHNLIQFEFERWISKGKSNYINFTAISEKISGLGRHVRDELQSIVTLHQLVFFIPEQKIVRLKDKEALLKSRNTEYVNLILNNVKGALMSGRRARLENIIHTLFIETLKYSFNPSLCFYSLDHLKDVYIETVQSNNIVNRTDVQKIFSLHEYISIENAYQQVCDVFCNLQKQIISKISSKSIITNDAINYIRQNYANKISLNSISEYVCISPYYLCRIFKQETGKSLNEFIISVRVEHAKKLFDTTTYKVWEVCEKSGFHNSKYFSQVFKKIVGITPKEYKEMKKQEDK
ncbi:HTH-type transcriptional activator Btr [Oxobacter pfennigii]|uniref:HTH-type transcriptional activator Btr n=1 Tax=Oxobacter pfennigii TaxID=36849 RepID=A0A0P9AJI4_9CLOT|nr:response regulator transcription factor [Oxobacter pfennigii]KPU45564.1 HTH-type transcriptional activator Btr [Oxobacter pfennigii]